jgi:hypothetical protein
MPSLVFPLFRSLKIAKTTGDNDLKYPDAVRTAFKRHRAHYLRPTIWQSSRLPKALF